MKQSIVFSLLLCALLASCKDNTVTVYVLDQGTYSGRIVQFGVDGYVATDQSGATISLSGTTYSAATDASGNYQLNNVPAGIYDLAFTKTGYDSALIAHNQFSGAGTVFIDTQRIQAYPNDSITVQSATLHFDSVVRYVKQNQTLFDTFYTLTLGVRCSGPNAAMLTRAWVAISIDRPNNDTTYLGEDGYMIIQGAPPSISFANRTYLSERTKLIRPGDHINVFLRAYAKQPEGMPYFGSPASPFLTTKKILVQ